jgi:hypothetical protein
MFNDDRAVLNVPCSTAVQQTATCRNHEVSLSDVAEDSVLPACDALSSAS